MSEVDGGDRIARSLMEVRDEVTGHVRPPGAAAAEATVRRRKRNRAVATGVLALALLAAPAALVARTGPHPDGGGPTPAASADPAVVWRDFVACARSHGQPGWPDPVVNKDGSATFQSFEFKQGFEAVKHDCGGILDRLPPRARPTGQRTR